MFFRHLKVGWYKAVRSQHSFMLDMCNRNFVMYVSLHSDCLASEICDIYVVLMYKNQSVQHNE